MSEETVFQYTYTSLQRQEVLKLRRQYLSYAAQDAKKQTPDAHTDEKERCGRCKVPKQR